MHFLEEKTSVVKTANSESEFFPTYAKSDFSFWRKNLKFFLVNKQMDFKFL